MKIALLGDVAFYGKFCTSNHDIYKYFKPVSNILKSFDCVVLNLETPFIKKEYKKYGSKSAHIGSLEKNVLLLKYLNVTAVNLANNHIFDYGNDGYFNTIKILEQSGIEYFGTCGKQWVLGNGNNLIAFNGFCCYSTNPIGMGKNGINILNFDTISRNLIENDKKGYFNIISIHAGQEHVNTPNYDNIVMSRKWADIVPYIYYGHHPHVLQGIDNYHNSIIAHSLGNFCFDDVYSNYSKGPLIQMNDNNKSSVILSIEINDNRIDDYQIIPIFDAKPANNAKNFEIIRDVNNYSKQLKIEKKIYILEREIKLKSYINSRKKLRSFKWYYKRLNINSIRMIFRARINFRNYILNVKSYL